MIFAICLMQLGLELEKNVHQGDTIGDQRLSANPDPMVRFAIPNERQFKNSKQDFKISRSSRTRKITFVGDGANVRMPSSELPFKAPGLQWQGSSCLTTRQLQEQKNQMIKKPQ